MLVQTLMESAIWDGRDFKLLSIISKQFQLNIIWIIYPYKYIQIVLFPYVT